MKDIKYINTTAIEFVMEKAGSMGLYHISVMECSLFEDGQHPAGKLLNVSDKMPIC